MDSLKGTLTPMKVLNGTLNGGIAYGTFNYNELENKPSVNGTELIGNVNIPIPTKTSDLSNDSGFITDADVPTKTSDLTNDSGFITDADIPTKTSELTNDSGFITSEDIPNIPTNTSQLNNDSGFLTMNTTPVRSVNSQTGDVNLFIPNATSQLSNDAGFVTENTVPVKSVNNQTGNVELTADNIPYDSENSIAEKINEVDGKKIIAQALVSDTVLTTTARDYNTVSSRKFSDYDLLLFKLGNSVTDTRRTVVLPSNIWLSGWVINEGVFHGSTASTPSSYQYSSFNIAYKSDTSITASVSGSGTIAHLAIYGLKLST